MSFELIERYERAAANRRQQADMLLGGYNRGYNYTESAQALRDAETFDREVERLQNEL